MENGIDRPWLHRLLIDEGGRRAVTLRAPLVLTRNGSCNRSQFGIEIRLLDEMSNEAAEQRSDAQRVLDVRADVRDPQLESWVLQRGADDPPDVAGILDHAGCNKGVDVVLVLRERLEHLWKARARKLVVGGETVATQAGPMSLPERRGGAERQQNGQEGDGPIHDLDAAGRSRWPQKRVRCPCQNGEEVLSASRTGKKGMARYMISMRRAGSGTST